MKKLILIFTAQFLLSSVVFAETIISPSDDSIIADTVWTASESPYFVNRHVYIPEGVTLTIEAGAEILMQNGRKFDVFGSLNVLGTEANKVNITAQDEELIVDETSSSLRWGGIVFYEGSKGVLEHADIRYAGPNSVFPQPGGPAIYNIGGEVSVKNSNISKIHQLAMYLKSGTTTVENTVVDESAVGIVAENGSLVIRNSTISNVKEAPLHVSVGVTSFVSHNNFFKNNNDYVVLDIATDFDLQNNIFENNYFNHWVIGGSISHGKTRTLGPIDQRPVIVSGIIVEEGGILNIEPGTILKVLGGNHLASRGGKMFVNGTEEQPVILTTVLDDSVGGSVGNAELPTHFQWMRAHAGIVAENGGEISVSNMWIKNAGAGWLLDPFNTAFSAILNNGGVINGNNIEIFDTSHDSAIQHHIGTTTLSSISVDGGFNNVVKYNEGYLKIENSNLHPTYTNYSLINQNNFGIPDVRNNWWGTPEGPHHESENSLGTAPSIVGNALFAPWLGQPPTATSSPGHNPVIIVPGIMGSAYKNGKLVIDPILHTYDDLVTTLIANGYVEGVDLFTFPYEWRDSNVITSRLLRDKINEVQAVCDCPKVDLVAHSMGGLAAREYIQSDYYENDVDQLIFLGTPHKGAPKAYLTWEGGDTDRDSVEDKLILTFFKIEGFRNGFISAFDYIRNRPISSVQQLLPVFGYLKDKDSQELRTYPTNHPRNIFLENLNVDLDNLLGSGVDITNITGISGNDTIQEIRVIPTTKPGLWIFGEPDGFYDKDSADNGLERGRGDRTVPVPGSILHDSITNQTLIANHGRLPTVAAGRVVEILTGEPVSETIDTGITISPTVLLLQLLSPIDVVVTAPDGKRIGKNFETGEEYNEIPFAFYSGFETDEEYIAVLNPINGEYKIEVQGTDDGGEYGVLTSYISDDILVESEFGSIIAPDQVAELETIIDQDNPKALEVERPITLEILKEDIHNLYNLGLILDSKTRDVLLKQVDAMIKTRSVGKQVDKKLATAFLKSLKTYDKRKITEKAYNIIKADLEWLINH